MGRSRYPRKGHRLAPAALGEILAAPLPPQFGADPGGKRLRLADLDETAWQRFDEQTCRRLGREVIAAVGRAIRRPLPIGHRHLPAMPPGCALADLELEARTFHCLASAGVDCRPQDLPTMTIDGVLALEGFGAKSLVDLLSSLEYLIAHPEARAAKSVRSPAGRRAARAAPRYPRPGQLLAPQALSEVLLERLPARWVRRTPLRGARLCDLDESAWRHLSAEVIEQAARRIVARAAAAARRKRILRRRLPRWPGGARLEDLGLENRTYRCLARAGFDRHPEQLTETTVGELLALGGFGTKCLVDLLSALEDQAARRGQRDRGLTTAARALARLPVADVHFSDPRLGSLLRSIDTTSSNVGEMLDRILRRRFDPPDPRRLAEQLRALKQRIVAMGRLPIEQELLEIFASASSPRDRQIVAEYYGWDGRGGRTLEQLGRKHHLSRERIRQVCMRAIRRSRGAAVFAPVLDRAIRLLAQHLPRSLDELQKELDAARLSSKGLSVTLVVQAAEFLRRGGFLEIIEVAGRRLAVPPRQSRLPRAILLAARRAVASYGVATIRAVRAAVPSKPSVRVSTAIIRQTLEILPELRWLDRRRSWFRLEPDPRASLPGMIQRVLAVAGRIELGELHRALGRYRRSARRLPPRRVLCEYCRGLPGVEVRGRLVAAEPPLDWRDVLRGVERGLVEILMQHGPVLQRDALEEHCAERGINRFSFNAAVVTSPVIRQFGRSLYGLVGARLSPRAARRLVATGTAPSARRVLRAFRERPDGSIVLVFQLSKAAISGGVVTVPDPLKTRLLGRYPLRRSDGPALGTLVVKNGCAWGLGPALRHSGAREGDLLVVELRADRGEAVFRLGDSALLAQFEADAAPRECPQ